MALDAMASAVDLEQAFGPSHAQIQRQVRRSAGIWALIGAVVAAALQTAMDQPPPAIALAVVLGMLLSGWLAWTSANATSILQEGELRALLARLRALPLHPHQRQVIDAWLRTLGSRVVAMDVDVLQTRLCRVQPELLVKQDAERLLDQRRRVAGFDPATTSERHR